MSEQTESEQAVALARRVLSCLYIIVDEAVARDVESKVNDALSVLESRLRAVEAEHAQLLRFAGLALKESRIDHGIGDWDGGDVQDAMVSGGLLVERDVTAPCGENCTCAEFGFPTKCYFPTALADKALAAVVPSEERPNA